MFLCQQEGEDKALETPETRHRAEQCPVCSCFTLTYDKKEGGGVRELTYPGTVESLAKSVVFGILGAWAQITVLFVICVTLESH